MAQESYPQAASRTLLVQGAQHILGPLGVDLRSAALGLKLAERGGKSGEKELSSQWRASWWCYFIACG